MPVTLPSSPDDPAVIHPDLRTGTAPMSRAASRRFFFALVFAMAAFILGGAYYVTQMARTQENRERIQKTGPGNANAVPGFGVTDGAK